MRRNNHNISERLGGRLLNRSESVKGFHRFPLTDATIPNYPANFDKVQTIRIPLEGFTSEDLGIQVVQNLLIIKGESRQGFTEEMSYVLSQRGRREYEQVLELDEAVDLNRLAADLVDNTLIIRLYPKTEESEPAPVSRIIELDQ